jgi:hypothetical protein
MSGAEDKLPSGSDPSPNEVLTGTIGYLSADGTLGTLLQGAIFGTLVSVFTGGINLIQSIVALPVAAVDSLRKAATEAVDATITEPLGIVTSGAETSAQAIASQFGVFGFIAGLGVFLGGSYLVIQFLEEDETGNVVAIPLDLDLPFLGVDEEDDVE